ncbi:TonB-dependent receptor [Sphingomonas sp. C3-2]|uniref:TonB-dependent receptor n=1 Tax=Sphingomonas sp. C3-2 TaxID=3062169 RepID=UPI00294AC6D6|nr:TonB-dependent receptor [Sphingomonas sp. C3-2]WOK37207.1 TonB-dependent receptor [Sphingomonas sp. C3-2]
MKNVCKFVLATTALAWTMPVLAQEVEGQDNASSVGFEDIVVTAQRREEGLQSVPVAVTALSADTLDTLRVTNVRNLASIAPNLQVTAQGQQTIPLISIRGITSGSSTNSVDPKAGMYLNGVYVGRSVGAIFDLADIERVEVLRGPQGTLFGRNATAGAISIVTAPPTGEFGVKQLVSYGNDNAFRARTVLNLPELGALSLKIAYLHDEIDGDVKNLIGGKTIDLSLRAPEFGTLRFADTLGAKNTDALQVAARLKAADNVTIDYNYDYTDSRTSGRAVQLFGTMGTTKALHDAVLGFQPITGGTTNLSHDRLDAVANGTSVDHLTVQGHNLTVTWDQSDAVSVKSITAFRKFKQRPVMHDLAATGGLRFSAAQWGALLGGQVGAIAGLPVGEDDTFYSLLTGRSASQKQFTQELQFVVTQEAFDLVAGAFYFHEKAPAVDVLGVFQPVTDGVVIPNAGLDMAFGSGTTRTVAINDSLAFYGQGTLHLSDTLDFAAGLRFTTDDRQTNLISVSGAQGGNLKPGTYKSSYQRLNYAAILTWKPNDALTAYGRVSTAYAAGGIMNAIPFGPESVTSYEVGVKSQWLNNRLRANAAFFYSDYKDIQVTNFIDGVQSLLNAGKAEIPGFEMELDALPTEWLSVGASVGYADFKYKEYVIGGVDIADISKPVYLSKWTTRLYGQVTLPEMDGGASPFARIDAKWRSDSRLVNPLPADPVLADIAITKAYWLVDGRVGVSSIPLGNIKVDVSAFGQNLFNKKYYSFGAPAIGLTGIYDRDRSYGIELTAAF